MAENFVYEIDLFESHGDWCYHQIFLDFPPDRETLYAFVDECWISMVDEYREQCGDARAREVLAHSEHAESRSAAKRYLRRLDLCGELIQVIKTLELPLPIEPLYTGGPILSVDGRLHVWKYELRSATLL